MTKKKWKLSVLYGLIISILILMVVYIFGRIIGLFYPNIPVSAYHSYFYFMLPSFSLFSTVTGMILVFLWRI